MAKIKAAGFAGLLLWVMVFVQIAITNIFEERVLITEAFATGDNIAVERCSNEIVAKLNACDKNLLGEVMEGSVCYDYEIEDISGKLNTKGICYKATGFVEEYKITATLTKPEGSADTYFHYIICSNKTPYAEYMSDGCYSRCERTMGLLEGKNAETVMYSRAEAVSAGKMSEEECRKYTDHLFDRIGADVVYEHSDGEYISYGYADGLAKPVVSNRKKMNVQVMFCYNEIQDETEINIGTPILTD
ncbi:MAG: hypothetical protein HFH14_03625 [Lachnospiraceae bacterium]|nr:hypothetical protein [Lachnospiraceae bacterium]